MERTPEEFARLEQHKAAQAVREPEPRMPRVKANFVMVSPAQIAKVHELGSAACWSLFMVLLFEDRNQHCQPFELSINKAISVLGLSEANLRRALGRLEGCGLISTIRKPAQTADNQGLLAHG